MRITIAVPTLLRDDANNLAMALAESVADGLTF